MPTPDGVPLPHASIELLDDRSILSERNEATGQLEVVEIIPYRLTDADGIAWAEAMAFSRSDRAVTVEDVLDR